jgi:hypothetical protein
MPTTLTSSQIIFNDNSRQVLTTNLYALGAEGNTYWHDVTSSRALGTTYTNTTGMPLMVLLTNNFSPSNALVLRVIYYGVQVEFGVSTNGGYGSPGFCIIIPVAATYSLPYTFWSFSHWWELRSDFEVRNTLDG